MVRCDMHVCVCVCMTEEGALTGVEGRLISDFVGLGSVLVLVVGSVIG